jgi:hypothetical protein
MTQQNQLTNDEILVIYDEYVNGDEKRTEIANRHGLTDHELYRRFKDLGLQPSKPSAADVLTEGLKLFVPTDYSLLQCLLEKLPENGRWTAAEREKHVTAYTAVLDLCVDVTDGVGE